jgi:hypothetical protein
MQLLHLPRARCEAVHHPVPTTQLAATALLRKQRARRPDDRAVYGSSGLHRREAAPKVL